MERLTKLKNGRITYNEKEILCLNVVNFAITVQLVQHIVGL